MKHHLFVFLEIFSREGGIQSYVKDVLQAYSSIPDTQATVFLLRDKQDIPPHFLGKNLTFISGWTKNPQLGRIKLILHLFWFMLKYRPNHIYCGHINLAILIQYLSQFFKIPYTILTYGKEVWMKLTPAQQKALNSAHRIWTISRYSRDQMCANNAINLNKVDLVPCVVDTDIFTIKPKPEYLLQRYHIRDEKVIMTVARLWSGDIYKGVDITLRALPTILKTYPTLKYIIIGRGDDQPRLMELSKTLNVEKNVIFAGFIPTDELPDYYNLTDAYIMPSQEGFGIVYLEAMSSGKPVLSGDADGSADPLQDGKMGWTVPHRDPEKVALACLDILSGNDRRCQAQFLREETVKCYSKLALTERLSQLIL